MAPEQFKIRQRIGCKADIWSVGIIFYTLLKQGKHPFLNKFLDKEDTITQMRREILFMAETLKDRAFLLFTQMTEHNPKWRISAAKALKNVWLNDYAQKDRVDGRMLG